MLVLGSLICGTSGPKLGPVGVMGQEIHKKNEDKLWQKIVKQKYVRRAPNIFCLPSCPSPSTFWKGVIWAAKALKFGYRWKVGGRGVKTLGFGKILGLVMLLCQFSSGTCTALIIK